MGVTEPVSTTGGLSARDAVVRINMKIENRIIRFIGF
jgi:hypothetical protein